MTREEFETIVNDFLEAYGEPWGEEIPVFWILIRCRTEGCPRNDDIHQEISPMAIPLDGVWKNVCGTCNKPVEDLNPQLTDDPDYRLPARYPDGSSWMSGA